ncbi:MAG: MFS transporter [Anaerolineae bacterium]|jgi:FSR family fosmidomycin resistance protein-like MFS transporter
MLDTIAPTTQIMNDTAKLALETQSPTADAETDLFQTGRVATVSAAHGVHDTYTAFLPSLLPVFIADLALSKTEAGLLTVFMQAPSLFQPFIGHLADRVSLRYLVILAPAVTAAMMSLLGVAPGYAALALLLMLAGLSSAGIHSVGPVLAGRLAGSRLGRGMGLWMVGGELGRTLGPIVIVSALRILTLRGTPWLMIAGLGMSVLLSVLLRDVAGRPPGEAEPLSWREALGSMGPLLAPLIGIIIVRLFMVSALTTYLPTFLTEEGAALFFAGASLSILEGAGVVGALLGGSLSDRLGRRAVLFGSMLATPLLMFAFLAADGRFHIPLLLLLGLSALSVGPVIMALVQESFPENRALANGVYMALSFVLRSGVIVVIGAIGDLFNLRSAFAVSAVAPLLGLPLILFLPPKRSK